ncbi:MAG: DUF2934 domain-containing protein [Gammaproteobacteria bacterium]|nr:DUF2934 domain-containing protein [Gammaproteobacteria bacterium]MBV8308640.1 DUF2934 domain-containing protein [Gammaproteobacteria bacterium]MBV8405146.1 DUF2934 domain-containing protein [Gammaproteobacteria bacterium]
MATRRSTDTVNPESVPVPESSARRAARPKNLAPPAPPRAQITPEARHALIAQAAYLRAERRGFTPGQEAEDWLAAEAEIDALLRVEQNPQ